jgi:hypothetical protein
LCVGKAAWNSRPPTFRLVSYIYIYIYIYTVRVNDCVYMTRLVRLISSGWLHFMKTKKNVN